MISNQPDGVHQQPDFPSPALDEFVGNTKKIVSSLIHDMLAYGPHIETDVCFSSLEFALGLEPDMITQNTQYRSLIMEVLREQPEVSSVSADDERFFLSPNIILLQDEKLRSEAAASWGVKTEPPVFGTDEEELETALNRAVQILSKGAIRFGLDNHTFQEVGDVDVYLRNADLSLEEGSHKCGYTIELQALEANAGFDGDQLQYDAEIQQELQARLNREPSIARATYHDYSISVLPSPEYLWPQEQTPTETGPEMR